MQVGLTGDIFTSLKPKQLLLLLFQAGTSCLCATSRLLAGQTLSLFNYEFAKSANRNTDLLFLQYYSYMPSPRLLQYHTHQTKNLCIVAYFQFVIELCPSSGLSAGQFCPLPCDRLSTCQGLSVNLHRIRAYTVENRWMDAQKELLTQNVHSNIHPCQWI